MKNKNISRRKFLQYGALGAATIMGGVSWAYKGEVKNVVRDVKRMSGSKESPLLVRQIVSSNNETGRTIMWETKGSSPEAKIELRRKGDSEIRDFSATEVVLSEDKRTRYIHESYIKGLKSKESYEYRVNNADSDEWYPLIADNGEKVKALLFPDSQSADYSDWQKLAETAIKQNKDANLMISMGDLVDNGEHAHQWDAWFAGLEPAMAAIPLAPIMGNHETYTLDWKIRLPEAYLKLQAVPDNGSKDFSRYYFSYDYGPIYFTVINTMMQEIDKFKEGLLEEQLEWVRKDLGETKKPWKVVLLHKDVLQYRFTKNMERKEGFSEIGRLLMPIFDEFKVDVVFSAHLHTYRNRGHIRNFERDSKGPLYIITGVAGDVRYPGLWIDHSFDEYVAPQPEKDNFLTIEATKNTLEVKAFQWNGTQMDHSVLRK